MSAFTIPLDEGQNKEELIELIQKLANLTKAAVTIKDQLCIITNNARLAIILKQIACDDPGVALSLAGGEAVDIPKGRGRRGKRKALKAPGGANGKEAEL